MVKVYRSTIRPGLAEADISSILDASRRHNQALGLSGMLLHGRGRFIQVLEGPGPAVDRTYRRILSDARHRDVILVCDGANQPRRFGEWAMGYARIEPYAHLVSVSHFMRLDDAMDLAAFDSEAALRMLLELRRECVQAGAPASTG